MKNEIKFLEDKAAHDEAQLAALYSIKADLEKLSLDVGQDHIASAITFIYLAMAEIVKDKNNCIRLMNMWIERQGKK